MKTVTVQSSKTYHIHIGSGLLQSIGSEAAKLNGVSRVCIVSDSNVFSLYAGTVKKSLQTSGFSVCQFVFPAGEASKNAQTYLALLATLAEQQLTRSDLIVALGGGVVGDLAGFAAATYLRGIRLIQVPTTLLAAVDASVGGKTAINLDAGKNLAGTFYQPDAVICDTDTLRSLPAPIFREGCAEVIKYGVLYDPAFFCMLEDCGLDFDLESVICRCNQLKANAVMADERDTGVRMMLNLGHTIGHSIEKRSHYTISHGVAVGMGMAIVARGTNCPDAKRIISLVEKFGLPTRCEYTAEELYPFMLSDKKRSGNSLSLIIPRAIGCCEIVKISYEELKIILHTGM